MAKKIIRLSETDLQEMVQESLTQILSGANEIDEEYQFINEMARISPKTTRLPMIVWLNPNDGTNTDQHNCPRLKFQDSKSIRLNPNEMVPISIHPQTPQILLKDYRPNLSQSEIKLLSQWIVKNYPVLISYWNNEIFEDELMERLKPL